MLFYLVSITAAVVDELFSGCVSSAGESASTSSVYFGDSFCVGARREEGGFCKGGRGLFAGTVKTDSNRKRNRSE